MKKLLAGFAVSFMAYLIISGAVVASGGAQAGDRDGTPDQDQNRPETALALTPLSKTRPYCFLSVTKMAPGTVTVTALIRTVIGIETVLTDNKKHHPQNMLIYRCFSTLPQRSITHNR